MRMRILRSNRPSPKCYKLQKRIFGLFWVNVRAVVTNSMGEPTLRTKYFDTEQEALNYSKLFRTDRKSTPLRWTVAGDDFEP